MSEHPYSEQWVYKNENDGNVVTMAQRSVRLDKLKNWTLLSSPEGQREEGYAGGEADSDVNADAVRVPVPEQPPAEPVSTPDPMAVNIGGPAVAEIPPADAPADAPAGEQGPAGQTGDGVEAPTPDAAADGEPTPPAEAPEQHPAPERPADRDLKPVWVEYALARDPNLTREEAQQMTKDDLISRYGG